MTLPIKKAEKEQHDALPISVYLPVFRWDDKEFIDLETQELMFHQIWRFTSQVYLNNQFRNGRKFRDARGKVSLKTKVFGFKALAEALSDARGLPISESEVKRMLQDAIDRGIPHAKFVLDSDLYPTSPQVYKELGLKNRWLIVAEVPSSDVMYKRINEQLKKAGSSLRIKGALKTKIVEA